jgi:hypothetical protein
VVTRSRARYVLAVSAAGADAVEVPPFVGLGLVPDSIWLALGP